MVFKPTQSLHTLLSVWEWCKNVWYSNLPILNVYHMLVWEWCKNVWYSNSYQMFTLTRLFENDVKMYGIQTNKDGIMRLCKFENDVKMYGIQTLWKMQGKSSKFENDVKMYGIQTWLRCVYCQFLFENDVKMYGIQTNREWTNPNYCLRMM